MNLKMSTTLKKLINRKIECLSIYTVKLNNFFYKTYKLFDHNSIDNIDVKYANGGLIARVHV